MDILISPTIKRFGGRDIIWIEKGCLRQGFYRSTGKNSGMAGVWLPFDGVSWIFNYWFDKNRFCENCELVRYGNSELKEISDYLGTLDIPKGEITKPYEINEFLDTKESFILNHYLAKVFEDAEKAGRLDGQLY